MFVVGQIDQDKIIWCQLFLNFGIKQGLYFGIVGQLHPSAPAQFWASLCLYLSASISQLLSLRLYLSTSISLPLSLCLYLSTSISLPLSLPLSLRLYLSTSISPPLSLCLYLSASSSVRLSISSPLSPFFPFFVCSSWCVFILATLHAPLDVVSRSPEPQSLAALYVIARPAVLFSFH